MERNFTCIVCPLGCQITAQLAGKDVVGVTGNACPRGEEYVRNECTDPRRTVTSTILCSDGNLISVRTERPIPKDKIMQCMAKINQTTAQLPIAIGDVIIKNAFGSNIVATQNRGK